MYQKQAVQKVPDEHHPTQVLVMDLAPEHYSELERAMCNMLSTDLAVQTFAQIVDGMPLRDIYREYYREYRDDYNDNATPSQEALKIVETYQKSFSINILQIDAQTAQAYQNTTIGSREFHLRLIEIVVILCHDIAVKLRTEFGEGINKPNPANARRRPPPTPPPGQTYKPLPPRPLPAEFYHAWYQDYDQYPNGVADIVGYWAELQLFGGVVLFDHGESDTECKDVFIHPPQNYKIYQLSNDQIQQWVDFALSPPEYHHIPPQGLRFKAEKYAHRVDPYDSMNLNIYRNRYERKIPEGRPRQCVVKGEDDPHSVDALMEFVRRTGRFDQNDIPPPQFEDKTRHE